ncbi:MAG: carboxypeptidase regulatory-like domain-containing protein [Gemmatimonadaceae bacterium]|jgi:hypothetical protein|nr:carboxypeptidase regulatory-like domain-containing protein [Gemmatimonadaceae bacterium]
MLQRVRQLTLAMGCAVLALFTATSVQAQVTTSAMRGQVVGADGAPLEGAQVEALHIPSGSRYAALTRADGRYTISGMRVGGPYRVTARRIGFEAQTQEGIQLVLGITADVPFKLTNAVVTLTGVQVTAESGEFSTARTGAGTTVKREQLEQLPTISRRIQDFTRLTPQANGNSFAGADNRLNNITVDGAVFNNGFGLGGQPGERTNVSPISLDAIEQIQVNIAPFDVRQGNFVGAGVNTVTKSGTNNWQGSLYYMARNESFVGENAASRTVNPGTFRYGLIGGTLGGPVIKDKLFFFASVENDEVTEPGTIFRANEGGETPGGNITRVRRTDLEQLSTFLQQNFGYETGPFQGYNFGTPSQRYNARLDYNLNDRNKFSLRYTQLNSSSDILLSNSTSLGFGNRRTSVNGLNFANSNYAILENIRSLVGEYNTQFGSNMSNQLIVGYTTNDESRKEFGQRFPFIDILDANTVYTSIGTEPFTPNNELRYNTLQFQNNFSMYLGKHDITLGASFERFKSENVFFPGSQSVYVYNSLADFYADANDFLANPNRTTSPVTLNRFQVRWSNIPGVTKPIQPLEVNYFGLYAQDEYRFNDRLQLTFGVRVDVPQFAETGFVNAEANGRTFRDENGEAVQYRTEQLPKTSLLWSPRFGFNWDVTGDARTKVRGGTGIFTGRPAFVWISNQIGNNGVLTGFQELISSGTSPVRNRPFNPNPDFYKPTPDQITGQPAASYELALTDQNFRFPQVWRSNIAVDRRLPWGLTGTAEFIYNQEVNGVYYINANLSAPRGNFTGADNRQFYGDECPATGSQPRIHCNISSAVVLKNQNVGRGYNVAFSLDKTFDAGLSVKTAYSYGIARNTVDAGSIAFGSWNGNQHTGDPNNPGLGISGTALGHRFFTAATYKKDFFGFGATALSLFMQGQTQGNYSWVHTSDRNGDGSPNNDLLYIPRDASEMVFEQFTAAGRTFTVQEQVAAWEAFISQDDYLSANRGKYAERGAAFFPTLWRSDLAITQDFTLRRAGKANTVQFRLDILNVGNLLNKNWGVSRQFTFANPGQPAAPIASAGTDAQGRARFRMRNIGNVLVGEGDFASTYQTAAQLQDVWRMQAGVRYSFF